MNKTELATALASRTGMTRVQASQAVNALFANDGLISEALSKGDTVTIPGFGTFGVSQTQARQGRNPRTGKAISIPARKRPVFRAGKTLRETLR